LKLGLERLDALVVALLLHLYAVLLVAHVGLLYLHFPLQLLNLAF
jgi:hypothetical protein